MSAAIEFFATAAKGLETLVAEELRQFGAQEISETRAGVAFRGSMEVAYRACLWSRLASRILLPIARFSARTPEELYEGAGGVAWEEHVAAGGTIAVDANISGSQLTHSHYAALKLKDAVVDRFRERYGERPSVDAERPDLRINLHIDRDMATVSLDLSGESLHRRGYRQDGVLAPLKENLAAAILLRCGWPEVASGGGTLVDPMCGSGTLVIEAALMAADIAPGLQRTYFGFAHWKQHDAPLWERLLEEALQRREAGLDRLPTLRGADRDGQAVRAARNNADRAGVGRQVLFERLDVAQFSAPEGESGLVVVNPPYGERLGEVESLKGLYGTLGERLKGGFSGWKAAVFTGNPELGKELGLRARRMHTLFNGALQCKLLHFDVTEQWFQAPPGSRPPVLGKHAEMFANRLRKNLRIIGRWARQNDITCYRLYDRDLPDYAVAVDLYGDRVHVQEYQAPKSIDPSRAEARLREVVAVLPDVLDVPPERIALKVRQRQKGLSQYQKVGEQGQFQEVTEGGLKFLVNLTDYLDTGLFLDHRPTRALLRDLAKGRRFLNLFAYTGVATVYAAAGGAASTVTVDLSRTYLEWAQKNLALNGLAGPPHRFIQADCLQWLRECRERFDLIFLDPPTFSNSKRMSETFDVQRDHVPLLQAAADLLAEDGVLIFSNNNRKFSLDAEALPGLIIENITSGTIPKDFSRNARIHNCWRIVKETGQ